MLIAPSLGAAAVGNKKLTSLLYKEMRGRRPNNPLFFIPDHLSSQPTFKAAYHSPDTKPELRAILLNSLFKHPLDVFNTLAEIDSKSFERTKFNQPFIMLKEGKNGVYMDLVTISGRIEYKPKVTQELMLYRQAASPHHTIIEAITTEDQHGLYVAQGKNELFVALYTLADMLRIAVKTNDVGNKIYNYDDEPDEEELSERRPSIDYERFINNLNHMKVQIGKFEPMANRVGVTFDTLYRLVNEFISELTILGKDCGYTDINDEILDLYRVFMMVPDIAEEINNVITRVKAVDKTQFPKKFAIPKFVDYNPDKSIFRREKVNLTNFQDEIKGIEQHFTNRLSMM